MPKALITIRETVETTYVMEVASEDAAWDLETETVKEQGSEHSDEGGDSEIIEVRMIADDSDDAEEEED